MRSEATDLAKVHKTFLKLLSESREVKGISPIFHIDYVSVMRELIEKGVNVELIITDEVLKNIIDSTGLLSLNISCLDAGGMTPSLFTVLIRNVNNA